jgi:hypothetical protein
VARRREVRNLTEDEIKAFAAQLVDVDGAAKILGLNRGSSVRVYATRHPDFPQPVWPPNGTVVGKSQLWWAPTLVAWRDANPRRSRARDESTDPS